MTVAAVLFTSSGHLEAGNRLEVHHLQHLLGLSIDLDDVLEESVGHVQLVAYQGQDKRNHCGPRFVGGQCSHYKPASKHAHHVGRA